MGCKTGKDTGTGMNADYRWLRIIGEGAFSRVYLAEGGGGQRYACKVSSERKMIREEAEILSSLYHPLFPVYAGYEESGGMGHLFMEYIPGRSLRQMIQVRGRFSPQQTMRIAGELADGLRYLHERQPTILYRDLKPENVMLCENGQVKLVDLGCACCQDAQSGARAGTPGFAAPEQLVPGGTAGIYSDVYGLGKTVQAILENRAQCRGKGGPCAEKVRGKKRKRCSGDKRCGRRLEHMIETATREDFRQRPQDMTEISHILMGKVKTEKGIICEKNIWESCYKNSCSLPSI